MTGSPAGIRLEPKTSRSLYKRAGRRAVRTLTGVRATRAVLRAASLAGLLPRAIWKRLPVTGTFRVRVPGGGHFRYTTCADDAIGRALYWRAVGSWEAATIRLFRRFATRARVFLDIGANSGIYVILGCLENPRLRVHAFEPVPHVYDVLVEHTVLNGCRDRCQTYNIALSDFVGEATLHVPFGDLPSSASLDPHGFRGRPGRLIDVPVTSVDALGAPLAEADLVKIDVEGFEDRVLLGMKQLLSGSRPAIIIECLPDGPYRRVEQILAPLGYRFFHLRRSGPAPMDRIVPDMVDVNYACLPPARLHWLTS